MGSGLILACGMVKSAGGDILYLLFGAVFRVLCGVECESFSLCVSEVETVRRLATGLAP